jgi:hypothetical protein
MTRPEDLDREAPEADAAEQSMTAEPDDGVGETTPSSDIEAPEWDAWEQSQTVQFEDEYR